MAEQLNEIEKETECFDELEEDEENDDIEEVIEDEDSAEIDVKVEKVEQENVLQVKSEKESFWKERVDQNDLSVMVSDRVDTDKTGLTNGSLSMDNELDRFSQEDEETEENNMEDDDDDDEEGFFNPMADCVILEEGDECLQFSDDRPSSDLAEDRWIDPSAPAVNGNDLVVCPPLKGMPISRRKKRIPSKVLSDHSDEDLCQVIWSDPSENGSCRVCRGHCPGPKCRKCRAIEVQGRKRYVCLLCDKTINHMGNFGQHVRSHVSPICHICHKTFNVIDKLEQHMQFHRKKLGLPMKKCRKQKTPIKIEASLNEIDEDDPGGEVADYYLNENSSSPHYETNGDICELLQVDIMTKSGEVTSNGKELVEISNRFNDDDDDEEDEEEEEEEEELEEEDMDEDEEDEKEEVKEKSKLKGEISEQMTAIDLSMSTWYGGELNQCEYCFGLNCLPDKCSKSRVETVEDRTTYECLICGKVIINHKGNFKQHVRSHTDFSCKQCGKKFTDAIKLKKHAEVHSKEKTYPCDVCSKTFRVFHHLKMHKERAHIKEKKYDCTNCERVFASRGELMSHIRWTHMGPERPFECELCQKTFAYKNNLKIHMRIHTNDKPYACEVCGRAFTQSSSLKMHMTVHAFNRNVFKCESCDKSFPYASNLKLHVKSAHSGLNPTRRKSTTCACQLCGLGFTHRNSLKAHMRTAHSFYDYASLEEQNEKLNITPDPDAKLTSRKDNKHRPHICPACGKGFTQRGSLKTHMRVLHNADLTPDAKHAFPFLASLLPPPSTPSSPPAPNPPNNTQPTNNNYDESQFLKCGVCGSLFAHYEHLESHICIHSV